MTAAGLSAQRQGTLESFFRRRAVFHACMRDAYLAALAEPPNKIKNGVLGELMPLRPTDGRALGVVSVIHPWGGATRRPLCGEWS